MTSTGQAPIKDIDHTQIFLNVPEVINSLQQQIDELKNQVAELKARLPDEA